LFVLVLLAFAVSSSLSSVYYTKRLARKNVFEITCFLSSGTLNLSPAIQFARNKTCAQRTEQARETRSIYWSLPTSTRVLRIGERCA